MAIYQVETDDGSVYEVETEDSRTQSGQKLETSGEKLNTAVQSSVDKAVQSPLASKLPPELTASLGTIASVGANAAKLNPFPVMPSEAVQGLSSFASPLTSPTGQKLEAAGEKLNTAVQGSFDNAVQSPLAAKLPPELTASLGAVASGVSEVGKLTPTNLAINLAAEFLGGLNRSTKLGSYVKNDLPVEIAENTVRPPSVLAESRRMKGKPTVGEEVLSRPELGNIPNDIYARAKEKVFELNNQAKKMIKDISSKTKEKYSPLNETADKIDGVFDREEFINSLDNLIQKKKNTTGDRSIINGYEKVKKDILSAGNKKTTLDEIMNLKSELDSEVNDAYMRDSDKLSSSVKAKEQVANSIRKIIYEKYPKLKGIMQEESALMDIMRSAGKETNKEIRKTLFERLFSKNIGAARAIKKTGDFLNPITIPQKVYDYTLPFVPKTNNNQ